MSFKKYFYLYIIITLFSNCVIRKNIDSLKLWEFNFSKSSDNKNQIGTLILKRKINIHNKNRTKVITPQIIFEIYPIFFADSISDIELDRLTVISCCYPVCGATIYTTKDYVFWSNPWSITSAFGCNGTDYTRRYANLILGKVKSVKYNSIDELIAELPIEPMKK